MLSIFGLSSRFLFVTNTARRKNIWAAVDDKIQLIDGIEKKLKDYIFKPHRFGGIRYDCGSKFGHLQANLVYAFKDPILAKELSVWLKSDFLPHMIDYA